MYIANTSVGGVLTLASFAMLAHGLRRFYRCGVHGTPHVPSKVRCRVASNAAPLFESRLSQCRPCRSNRCGKRWTHRRRRMVRMAGAELGLQFINSALFLAPNV